MCRIFLTDRRTDVALTSSRMFVSRVSSLHSRETHNDSPAGIRSHFEYNHDGVSHQLSF